MDLLTRQRNPLLCTEPLEGRRLLSAPALPDVDDPDDAIEIVEFDFAEESDEGDVELSPSDVPEAVLAAFRQRFPGAEVLEAEYSEEDGAPEYDLTARFQGDLIDATLTPGGRLLETEEAVTSDDLPQEVLDWLGREFPGAEIEEASIVTGDDGDLTYEVGFSSPGEGELEATLRVEESPPPPETQATVPLADGELVPESPAPAADRSGAWLAEPAVAEPNTAQDTAGEPASPDASESGPEAAPAVPAPRAEKSPFRTITSSSPFSLSFRAIVPTRIPAPDWLPQLVELFADTVASDATAVEQALAAILSRIESATIDKPEDEPQYATALRMLLVAALLGGAHLLLVESRRAKAGPVFHFNTATSSWSWLLGAPPPDRR